MTAYPFLLAIHLFAALLFIGTVAFEVIFLAPVMQRLPADVRDAVAQRLRPRMRAVMPWVVLALFVAGLGMAWQYRDALASPGSSAFGLLLTLKVALAFSVLTHVVIAMRLARQQRLPAALSRRVHISVFCHMVGIVLLAKFMFHLSW
ncbi:putative membrane protein [plant metagenome]|uniref:Putative membrane protein n=1 Tax=plant metagenome TaxID=1297885 RepID=A0A484UM69_9ZZZZ